MSFIIGMVVLMTLHSVNGQRQAQCCADYCYALDEDRVQAAHFGSKTSYSIAKGPESGRQYLVPNCKPMKMWILSRHGTRLPDKVVMERLKLLGDFRNEIIDNYEKRHTKPAVGAMCDDDLDLLKKWRWDENITADYSGFLTVQGWDELKFMAIRYQTHFPAIMESVYNREKFLFRYTNTQRTEASFKAFVEGLFGPRTYENVRVDPPPMNDTLLRPYDFCPALDLNGDKSVEYTKYLESQTIKQVIADVSERLGFKYPLKVDQILDMYEMCRYDQAWHLERASPWCAAFTPNQIDDIEYLEDVQKYYKSGFGNKLSAQVPCEAVNDMLKHLGTNNQPKAVTYFTHSRAIILFLTGMQVAKDSDSLRADNYYSMQRRKWRMSELSPFASNFAAIKYDCPNEIEREKVMFFLNEKPLNFDWCKVGLCNWSDVKNHYKEYTQGNCDTHFCTSSAPTNYRHMFTSVIMTSVSLVVLISVA